MTIHSAYRVHSRVQLDTGDESMTRQEFADECDINVLMARYQKSGIFPQADRPPMYLDVASMPDLQSALHIMMDAETAFQSLPAVVRKEFDNDPLKFVDFAQDEKNVSKLREWGLAEPVKAPEAPLEVRVVNPAEPLPAGSAAPTQSFS